jgi:hypothetical protein
MMRNCPGEGRHDAPDAAAVHAEALRHLDIYTVRPDDPLVDRPGLIPALLERRFLATGCQCARPLELPGLSTPRRLARVAAPTEVVGPRTTSSVQMRHPPPGPRRPAHPFRAGGRERCSTRFSAASWRAASRWTTSRIACATAADAVLAWEKAQRRAWPVTLEPGMAVAQTRPVIERPCGRKRSVSRGVVASLSRV